jgi:hypothetical protein
MSDWTPDTVRAYLEVQVEQLRRENVIRDDATAALFNRAQQANEHRFEAVNEFRGQLNDQATTFLRRDEYLTGHAGLVEKIDDMGSRLDRTEGKATGMTTTWAAIIAALGTLAVVTSVIVLLINHV